MALPGENAETPAEKPRLLAFAGDQRSVAPGLGRSMLRTAESVRERGYTYALLFLNEYLSDALERELAEAGVEIIGPHGAALKVRVPTDLQRLQAIAAHRNVMALAHPPPDQKLEPRARRVAKELFHEIDELPVVVNAFDASALKDVVTWLKPRATVGRVDRGLVSVMAIVPIFQLYALAGLDGVLWVELSVPASGGHDESMPTMGLDYIRPGGEGNRYSGATTVLGILDTGFMAGGGQKAHVDLVKFGCGVDYTREAHGVWNDEHGHGTHVLATAIGTGNGTADARYRGAAPDVGSSQSTQIRAAKIWDSSNEGTEAEELAGSDFMVADAADACGGPIPEIVSMSGGAFAQDFGTDARARKADQNVWARRQAWVVCGGNNGPAKGTMWTPGTAKNVITVGNVQDSNSSFGTTASIWDSSSRGPTGDGRLKPNVVATGAVVTSAKAGTKRDYTELLGCSMATPHVSGVAATLLEHHTQFVGSPQLLRAHLMATSILHDGLGARSNTHLDPSASRYTYGLGRVSPYVAHWDHMGGHGWFTEWATRVVDRNTWGFMDINVPERSHRMVVVMTWDEPPASAGASRAVSYDLDLWVDRAPLCTPDSKGQCGEWSSKSYVDNVEYVIIDDPEAGLYRLKVANWDASRSGLPAAVVALIVKGSVDPGMAIDVKVDPSPVVEGGSVSVETIVKSNSWMLSGAYAEALPLPETIEFDSVTVKHPDNLTTRFCSPALALGTIPEGRNQSAVWKFTPKAAGLLELRFQFTSENGGSATRTVQLTVQPKPVDGGVEAEGMDESSATNTFCDRQ